ncbi:protein claret segregational [Drosophila tropicalis]|uniref:protein claret segregational n=1 Tax=Drosophila tropicalis TaxID=46794 RepID=UPI0035ABA109
MESRLPKPLPFRPMQGLPKNILPGDRIKSAATGGGEAGNVQPLSRDMSNSRNFLARPRARAASPEPLRTNNRAKLRRSRSACDVNELRQGGIKRTALPPILPSVPSKFSRTTATTTSTTTTSSVPTGTQQRTSRPPLTAARKPPVSTSRTAARTASAPAPTARSAAATKTGGAAASSSTAAATAPKRIAPYDFKARFHDLLEKHKALKTKYEKQVDDLSELETMPMQLEETQNKLIETETKLKNTLSNNESLYRQVKQQTDEITSLTATLGRLNIELTDLKTKHEQILSEHQNITTENVELRQRTKNLQQRNEAATEENKNLQEQLFKSNMERKVLHNSVMDLKGNIRVFCRIRPPLDSESGRISCFWNYHDEATVEIQSLEGQQAKQIFTFDQVFHPNCSQTDIFDMVSPLIQSALDGYNICIFAYGQTGSGKTYTMDGVTDSVGVIPRTVDLLFDSINSYKNMGWEYEIRATFLEIYNEVLYDLLSNEAKDMEIRMAKNNKNDIYVSNITEECVRDPAHLRHLMATAKMNRATASTIGNERSSRSHAVTKLQLIGRHAAKQEISIGSINLVDLAGSESPKTSVRMTETKNINRSLSELTNCILALLQKQDHIPYRNSKLTHLLMPALGGNSKTLMFINVSPFQDCYQESVKSLRFATSVNSCKMTKAKRVRVLNNSSANNSRIDNSV